MTARPRVGIVGPLLGGNAGWVVSQGEVLARNLRSDGYPVLTTSSVVPRVARAVDTVRTMRSWRGHVDVVVVLGFSGPAFVLTDLGVRLGHRLDVPVVLWLHGGDLPTFADRHRRWTRRVLRAADRVVAPSDYLAALGPGAGRRVEIVPNVLPDVGPDAPWAHPPSARPGVAPTVLWMRTFHPLYRPQLAVEAFARIVQDHPGAHLTMAGQDKGELAATRRAVTARGLDAHVHFAGFLGPQAKVEAFASHDVFLNTTSTDNAPVSLLEAASRGLVVVSTPAGGVGRLFTDGCDALLAADAEGLAAAVDRLVAEPELANRLSGAGLVLAQSATWERVGPQWHRLLDRAEGIEPVEGIEGIDGAGPS